MGVVVFAWRLNAAALGYEQLAAQVRDNSVPFRAPRNRDFGVFGGVGALRSRVRCLIKAVYNGSVGVVVFA